MKVRGLNRNEVEGCDPMDWRMALESLNDKMPTLVHLLLLLLVVVAEVVLRRIRSVVDKIPQGMGEQRHEENFPLNQQIAGYDERTCSAHAFGINVSNRIHVVGILSDIDQHRTADATVSH